MSLRARLLLTLGLTLAVLWGIAAAWLMRDLEEKFVDTLDQRLAQSARMVAGLVLMYGKTPSNRSCRSPPLKDSPAKFTHPQVKLWRVLMPIWTIFSRRVKRDMPIDKQGA